jgi:hypothetical protein
VILLYSRYRKNREECSVKSASLRSFLFLFIFCVWLPRKCGKMKFECYVICIFWFPEMNAFDPVHDFNRIFPLYFLSNPAVFFFFFISLVYIVVWCCFIDYFSGGNFFFFQYLKAVGRGLLGLPVG